MRRRFSFPVILLVGLVTAALLPSDAHSAAPAGRFTVSNGTVSDSVTGLTWQQAVPSQLYTWSDAQSYCAGLSLGTPSGKWRLPTVKELMSIVDFSTQTPAIDQNIFPGTPGSLFWSVTTTAGGTTTYPWGVYFNFADTGPQNGGAGNVRCVR